MQPNYVQDDYSGAWHDVLNGRGILLRYSVHLHFGIAERFHYCSKPMIAKGKGLTVGIVHNRKTKECT